MYVDSDSFRECWGGERSRSEGGRSFIMLLRFDMIDSLFAWFVTCRPNPVLFSVGTGSTPCRLVDGELGSWFFDSSVIKFSTHRNTFTKAMKPAINGVDVGSPFLLGSLLGIRLSSSSSSGIRNSQSVNDGFCPSNVYGVICDNRSCLSASFQYAHPQQR